MKGRNLGIIKLVAMGVFVLLAANMGLGVQPAESNTRVVVAQGVEPTKLDPDMHREQPTENVILHIYDALLERDQDAKIKP